MLQTLKAQKLAPRPLLKLLLVLALCIAFVLVWNHSAKAKTVYEIFDRNSTLTIESYNDNIDEVLDEAGITLSDSDFLAVNREGDAVQLNISRAQFASVSCDGAVAIAQISDGETVGALLERLNISVGEHDLLSAGLEETVLPGDTVSLQRVAITYYTEEESIPYTGSSSTQADLTGKTTYTYEQRSVDGGEPTVTLVSTDTVTYYTEEDTIPYESKTVEDSSLAKGTKKVTQAGANGKTIRIYEQRSVDGGEPTITLVNTETVEPTTEITSIGTKVTKSPSSKATVNGDTVTVNGKTYSVRYVTNCQATAYTSSSGAYTASGKRAQVGIVAVDPSVFPFGTRMLIVSNDGKYVYMAVAGDTGGAIKGHIVDLYFDTERECSVFGRRNCTVYVLD